MNTPGVDHMPRKKRIIETYSLIWNAVDLITTGEAIQDTQQTASLPKLYLSYHTVFELVMKVLVAERKARAENTPVQLL